MEQLERKVRLAARALARAGLVGPYGHCSMRIDAERFLVCAARPMGMIAPGEPGVIVPVTGPLPPGVLGEVRMHQALYAARPEVRAVCRFISPHVLALAAMGLAPRARHGFSSYFYPAVPFLDAPLLVRTDDGARMVAEAMGDAPAIVVGPNGALTAADSIEKAVTLAWYLEDAARVELAVRAAGGAGHTTFTSAEQAAQRATWEGRIAERMWEYLTDGDPE